MIQVITYINQKQMAVIHKLKTTITQRLKKSMI